MRPFRLHALLVAAFLAALALAGCPHPEPVAPPPADGDAGAAPAAHPPDGGTSPALPKTAGTLTETLVCEERSEYSHIRVKDTGPVRTLYFVRDNGQEVVETAMDLERPHLLQVPYTRAMFASHLFLPRVERVLIVGLGGGAMVRFLGHFFPDTAVDAVEIDPVVVRIADERFGTRPGARTRIFTEDAFAFLKRAEEPYDVIYMDAFLKPDEDTDATGVPLRLKTVAFFKSLHRNLKPGGLVVFNLNPHPGSKDDVQSIRDAFPAVYLFPLPHRRNTVVVGSLSEERATPASLKAAAAALDGKRDHGFSFANVAALLRDEAKAR